MNKSQKMANGNHWLPLLCYNPCFTLISDRKNLIFLNFFSSVEKRFPLRNSTGFHRPIPPPIHIPLGGSSVARTSSWISTLSPLRMASVCISSVSLFQLIGSWNGVVRQLVGFSDGHETFSSWAIIRRKSRDSPPRWLCLFFYLSAMKPGFQAFFCGFQVN
jgi:hypothetical protein